MSIWNREITLGKPKITDKEKQHLYNQLYNLIDSGIDIRYSFEILEKQIKSKKTAQRIAEIGQLVIEGQSLSKAMRTSQLFTAYEYFSVEIGEETGKLAYVLKQLSLYYDNKLIQRRQIVSALSYPILILLSAIGAVSFMVFFIIPMFEEVFKRFGSDLPLITQYIISFSNLVNDHFLTFLLLVVLLFGINRYLSSNLKYTYFQERLILSLPLIGEIYNKIFLSRFCTSMGLLLSSEVPMISALEMVSNMINYQHLKRPIVEIKACIISGRSLYEAMKDYKVFDHEMIALVKVGEEVGKLAVFFDKLSSNYSEEVKHKTGLLNTVLEPAIIIFLGLVVGVILIAMYLPMFKLSTEIAQ